MAEERWMGSDITKVLHLLRVRRWLIQLHAWFYLLTMRWDVTSLRQLPINTYKMKHSYHFTWQESQITVYLTFNHIMLFFSVYCKFINSCWPPRHLPWISLTPSTGQQWFGIPGVYDGIWGRKEACIVPLQEDEELVRGTGCWHTGDELS